MHARLQVAQDPEAILQADHRTVVEAEEILGQLAEVSAPEVAREAVREPEIALVLLERHRRRQVDQVEIDLGRLEAVRRRRRRRLVAWRLRSR